jgi:putative MATE family efflux protein
LKQDTLLTAPVGKLLVQYSVPAIVAMTLSSLYNVIDSAFIGHGVGAQAIAGMAVTFPLMNLQVALSTLVGVGSATVTSISLGRRRRDLAEWTVGNAFQLALLLAVLFSGVCQVFLDDILLAFGAGDAILPYARSFMRVMLWGTPISYLMLTGNNILRATGFPHKAMLSSLLSVGCNLVLAPLFIFGFRWGTAGAALATLLSQSVALGWILHHFMHRHKTDGRVSLHFNRLKWNGTILRSIVGVGVSPFLTHLCSATIAILVTQSLQRYGGDWAIGAYGISNRIVTLCFMVVLGLAHGMQPIIGYNFGAGNLHRVRVTLLYGIATALLFTSICLLLIEHFTEPIVKLFSDDVSLTSVSVTALKLSCVALQAVGIQCILGNFFQSIGRSRTAILISISRQLLFVAPLLFILPPLFGLNAVWLCMPVADILACICALYLLWRWHVRCT